MCLCVICSQHEMAFALFVLLHLMLPSLYGKKEKVGFLGVPLL